MVVVDSIGGAADHAVCISLLHVNDLLKVRSLSALHHRTAVRTWPTESLHSVLLLNDRVVLAELRKATSLDSTNVLLLVRFDRLVMHATFMLRHQDVILLALFFRLDLLLQRCDVLLLVVVFLHPLFLLDIVDVLDSLNELIRIHGIILSQKVLFLLFFLHLGH